MSYNQFASSNQGMVSQASGSSGSITTTIKEKLRSLKTLVLKLKPSSRHVDVSSLSSEQLDHFVDDMTRDLQTTFIRNIDDLRDRVKKARPHPSDPHYQQKMALYQELLNMMIPIIQQLQKVSDHVLSNLQALIDRLWNDICKNEGREVDHLLQEYQQQTEKFVHESFIGPMDLLQSKLDNIHRVR